MDRPGGLEPAGVCEGRPFGAGCAFADATMVRAVPAPPFVSDRLAALAAADLLRDPPVVETSDGVTGRVNGREAVVLCSNDYLGLRCDPRVRAGAIEALEQGAGAGSSRLIAGSLPIHRALEDEIADWMGTEAALLCSSGYQANQALIGALTGAGDLIVSDALNHASLIDACRLSRASVHRVPHSDVDAVHQVLGVAARPASGPGTSPASPPSDTPNRAFVLGEGLYSMDGDRGPVAGWHAAATEVGAHLLVDEAHAVGVLGPQGRGTCAEVDVHPLARVGTLGKAFGAHGAFIATDAATRALIVNAGRAYVFSTAVAPAVAGAARAALRIIRSDEGAARRARVLSLARRLAEGAADLGFDLAAYDLDAPTPIVPVVLGSPARAIAVAAALLDRGVYAKAIRPPTVPPGTSRIRFTLSAAHTEEHVDRALKALQQTG